jgi:GT2 family glycosyltransferase
VPVLLDENVGYAGAVNKLFELAESEYVGYMDNDAMVRTVNWDEMLCKYLDRFHEIGIIFPGEGHLPLDRGSYWEVMWGTGFCFVLSRMAMNGTGKFDTSLGHQDECDYCLRLRMAGWKCACAPEVIVQHAATASTDPKANERIAEGVRNFVNKWTKYFCGKNINYHSPNVMRWEDWPPNALYLEEHWKKAFPGLNAAPEVRKHGAFEFDLVKVPRRSGFYRNRVI